MPGNLALIQPINPETGQTVEIRVGVSRNSVTLGLDNQRWHPAIVKPLATSIELLDEDMTGQVMIGKASLTISTRLIESTLNLAGLVWAGAKMTVWVGNGPTMDDMSIEFQGVVTDGVADPDTGEIPLSAEVDTKIYLDVPFLKNEFEGLTGESGDVEMRGTLRPGGMGRPINIALSMFDVTNNVMQIDAYGNLQNVAALYENAASFGASSGDYATYDALVAATIAPGSWATCIAKGLVRLGAPPAGLITCDPVMGAGTPGAMVLRLIQLHTELPINRLTLDDFITLDAGLQVLLGEPCQVDMWTSEQISVLEIIQKLCAGINAAPLLMPNGQFRLTRAIGGAEAIELRRMGNPDRLVTDWKSFNPPTPWWRLKLSSARTYRVHTNNEIDYEAEVVDLGIYKADVEYRIGNVVSLPDGSRWLFQGETPATGSLPSATNPNWFMLSQPITAGNIHYEDGTPVEDLKPAEPGATHGATPAERDKLSQLEVDTAAAQVAILAAQNQIDELEGSVSVDFSALNAAISTLNGEVDVVQGNITSLQSTTSAVQQSVSTLQGDVAAAQTAINTINLDVSAVEQSVANLTTSTAQDIGNLYSAVSTVQQDAAALQGSVSTLNGQVSGLQTQAAGIIGSIGQLGTEVDQIETTVSTQGGYITTLQQSVSNINGTVSTLSSTVSTQGGYISTLQQAVSTTDGNLATLRQEVNAGGNPNLLANASAEQGNLSSWSVGFGTWNVGTPGLWGPYFWLSPPVPASGVSYYHIRHGVIPFAPSMPATVSCDIDLYGDANVLAYSELRFLDGSLNNVLASANSPGAAPARQFSSQATNRSPMAATLWSPAGTAYAQFSVVVQVPAGASLTGFAFRQAKLEVGTVASAYSADASIVQSFTAITTLEGSMASLTTRVGTAESSIVTNATAISTTNGNLASLSSTVSSQGGSISTLQSSVSTLSGTVSTLSSTVSTQGGQISSLQSVQSTQAGTIAQHTTDISTANANISTNAQAISTTNGNLASLSSTVSSQGGSITSLQSAVSTANGNIASLTTQVEAGVRPNLLTNGTGEMGLDFWTSGYGNWTSNANSSIWGNYFYVDNAGPSGQKFYHLIQWARFSPGHYASAAAEVDLYGGAGTRAYLAIRFCDEAYNILTEHSGASLYAPVAFSTSNNRKALSFSTPQVAPPGTSRAAFLCIFYTPDGTSLTSAAFRRAKLEQGAVSTPYSADASISQQWTAFSTLNTSFASLTTRVASAEGSVSTLQSSMTSANGSISTLQQSVSSLNGSVSTLQQSSSTQAGQISSLQSTVSTQGSTISQNSTAISTINGSLATLSNIVAASSSPNLLANGGFENGLTGWTSAGQTFYQGGGGSYWGTYGQVTNLVGNGGDAYAYIESGDIGVPGGNPFTLSMDFDVYGVGRAYGEIVWYTPSGPISVGTPAVNPPKSFDNSGASRSIITAYAPASATKARVRAVFNAYNGGTITSGAVRQIKFEMNTFATPYSGEASAGQMYKAYSDLNTSHASLSSTVSTQGGYISTLQSTTTSLSGTVSTLSSTVSSQGSSISSLQTVQSTQAGTIATLQQRITVGGNLLQNTEFAIGSEAWYFYSWDGSNSGFSWGRDHPDLSWSLTNEHMLGINQADANSGRHSQFHSDQVPVIGGRWYEASALTSSHRCYTQLRIDFYDANGNGIVNPTSSFSNGFPGFYQSNGGSTASAWQRLWLKYQAPSNAARASLIFIKVATSQDGIWNGATDSWGWMCRPQFAEVYAETVGPTAYFPGLTRATVQVNAQAISTLNGQFSSLSSTVSTQGSSISQNATAISTLNGTVATLSSTVSSQGSAITTLQTTTSTLQGNVATLTTRVQAGGGSNLIRNASFENGLDGWSTYGMNWQYVTGTTWGSYAYVGISGSISGFQYIDSPRFNVEAGGQYTASFDFDIGTANNAAFDVFSEILWFNGSGTEISRAGGNHVYGNGARGFWYSNSDGTNRRDVVATAYAPSGAVQGLVRLVGYSTQLANFAIRQAKIERGAIASPYSVDASIVQQFQTLTTLNTQYASLSSTVSTQGVTINTQSTAITTLNGNVSTLFGQYGVEIDVNGYGSGFKLNNNGYRSDAIWHVDRFAVGAPGNGTAYPFQVIDGITYMKNAMIQDAAITTAKIGDLQVDTAKIAGNAVTIPVIAYTAASSGFSSGSWTTIQSAGIVSSGAPIGINMSFYMLAIRNGNSPNNRVRLLRDGGVVFGDVGLPALPLSVSQTGFRGSQSFAFMDQPGAGSHTYELQVIRDEGTLDCSHRVITLTEYKK